MCKHRYKFRGFVFDFYYVWRCSGCGQDCVLEKHLFWGGHA